MHRTRLQNRLQLAVAALVALLGMACDQRGRMPPDVSRGLSDFFERAAWVRDLPPPPGASAGGLGGGGVGGSGDHFQFSVSTSLPPDVRSPGQPLSAEAVLDHYSSLLEARGWRAAHRLIEETVGLETFQWSDADGRRWHGLLYTTSGDTNDGRVAVAVRSTRLPDLDAQ